MWAPSLATGHKKLLVCLNDDTASNFGYNRFILQETCDTIKERLSKRPTSSELEHDLYFIVIPAMNTIPIRNLPPCSKDLNIN